MKSSLISRAHLTPSNLTCWERWWEICRWACQCSPGSLSTCLTDPENLPVWVLYEQRWITPGIHVVPFPLCPVQHRANPDFQYRSDLCHLQRFSVDSVGVGCIKDGQKRAGETETCSTTCIVWYGVGETICSLRWPRPRRRWTIEGRGPQPAILPLWVRILSWITPMDTLVCISTTGHTRSVQNKDKRLPSHYFLRKISSGPSGVCNKMLEILHQHVPYPRHSFCGRSILGTCWHQSQSCKTKSTDWSRTVMTHWLNSKTLSVKYSPKPTRLPSYLPITSELL